MRQTEVKVIPALSFFTNPKKMIEPHSPDVVGETFGGGIAANREAASRFMIDGLGIIRN